MNNKATARARTAMRELDDVPTQLAALESMTVGQLAEKWRKLYGEPTRTRNKDYLKKRLAWRIQELAEGGLSQGALARIHQLGDQMPERWRMRQSQGQGASDGAAPTEALQVVRGAQVQDALGHRDGDRRHALERVPLLRAQEARRVGARGVRSMSDFFRTQMGHRFYESTMPSLVRELARLNANLERLLDVVERDAEKPDEGEATPAPSKEPR